MAADPKTPTDAYENEIRSLKTRLEDLGLENKALQEKLTKAEKAAKSKCPKGDHVVHEGKLEEVLLVDTAWEVGQKVEKSYCGENNTTIVLKRYGA